MRGTLAKRIRKASMIVNKTGGKTAYKTKLLGTKEYSDAKGNILLKVPQLRITLEPQCSRGTYQRMKKLVVQQKRAA